MSKALRDILIKFDKDTQKNADKVMQETVFNMFGAVIEGTPEGDFDPDHVGTLKGGWVISRNSPSKLKPSRRMPGRTRKSIRTMISNKIVSKNVKMYMTNNHEYANVVEYGGYPKRVKRGTYNKVSGRWQVRSTKGYSKQAPKGMVRVNTREFKRILELSARNVFNKGLT
tara:strand:- start:228 stop:737 length:510 start_codon:yes stop_codon:yes gene_type:complete